MGWVECMDGETSGTVVQRAPRRSYPQKQMLHPLLFGFWLWQKFWRSRVAPPLPALTPPLLSLPENSHLTAQLPLADSGNTLLYIHLCHSRLTIVRFRHLPGPRGGKTNERKTGSSEKEVRTKDSACAFKGHPNPR